jgi:salicylate hydroxylase
MQLGVEVRTGCKVVKYDLDYPSVTLDDGSTHGADLVVAAEGLRNELFDCTRLLLTM